MKKILPTQAKLQELLDYDPHTGELTWKTRDESLFKSKGFADHWNKRYAGKPAFTAIDAKGYNVGAIHDVYLRAHRLIYKLMTDQDPDQVDHIDGNRTNNAWANLRDVSGAQNQKNMKRDSRNASGISGVFWDEVRQKWVAYISSNGKRHHLGRFTEKDDAIAARKKAESTHGFHQNHGR